MSTKKRKSFALIILLIIFIALLLSLLYFLTPKVNKAEFTKYQEYNLSNKDENIEMLCLITEIDINHFTKGKCLHTELSEFKQVDLSNTKILKTTFNILQYDDSLILLTLNMKNGTLSIEENKVDYEGKLRKILESLDIQDFVIVEADEDGDVTYDRFYLNLHDYIATRVYLIKYYTEKNQDLVLKYLEDSKFIPISDENIESVYSPAIPANILDIKFLSEIDPEIGREIRDMSTKAAKRNFLNISYQFSRNDYLEEEHGLDFNILKYSEDIYRLESYINEDKDLSDEYENGLKSYKDGLLYSSGLTNIEFEVISKYFPSADLDLLLYFSKLHENGEEKIFFDDMEMLMYYFYNTNTIDNSYKIVNILYRELSND